MADPTPIPATTTPATSLAELVGPEVARELIQTGWDALRSSATPRPDLLHPGVADYIATKVVLAVAPALLAAGRTEDIPGWVHEYGVSFDGDTHWLECDFCSTPVHGIDAGDSFETIVTKARDHRRSCVAEKGADRG